MSNKPRDKQPHRGQSGKPPEHHGSSPVELAAINETFIAFAEEHNKNKEQHPRRDYWKFVIEIVAVVGVGIYTVITGGLLIASLVQIGKSSDQIDIARDTEQRQLRAYVGVIPGDVESFGVAGEQKFKILRKNYGTTPAYDVGFSVVGEGVFDPTQFNPNGAAGIQGCSKPPGIGLITMFPGTELPFAVTLPTKYPSDQIDKVRLGKWFFAYWGNICYKDSWDRSHFTDYCWTYKGADMSAKTAEGCLTHNNSN